MPMLEMHKGETVEKFTKRFMENDAMKAEYPDVKQRYAVCMSQARRAGRNIPKPKGK